MKRRGLVVLTMVTLGFLFVPARAAPPTDISIRFRAYDPNFVRVPLGGNVRWSNNETGLLAPSHTVTDDDGSFDSGTITPGGNFHLRFTASGVYTYHCKIHSTMHGTVVVGSPSSTTTASPTPTTTKAATPTPTPTRSRSRSPSPKPSASASVFAEPAPSRTDDSSAGTIISVAIIVISVLIGLGYFVYLRYLRAQS